MTIMHMAQYTLLLSNTALGFRPGTGKPALANLMKYF